MSWITSPSSLRSARASAELVDAFRYVAIVLGALLLLGQLAKVAF